MFQTFMATFYSNFENWPLMAVPQASFPLHFILVLHDWNIKESLHGVNLGNYF